MTHDNGGIHGKTDDEEFDELGGSWCFSLYKKMTATNFPNKDKLHTAEAVFAAQRVIHASFLISFCIVGC